MVEDNRGDVILMREAMDRVGLPFRLTVARNGVEAMECLRNAGKTEGPPLPGLVMLDLKLPLKGGQQVLAEIDADPRLCRIPLVVLSSSRSELAIAMRQASHGRRYIAKPGTFEGFVSVVQSIEEYRRGFEGGEAGART